MTISVFMTKDIGISSFKTKSIVILYMMFTQPSRGVKMLSIFDNYLTQIISH